MMGTLSVREREGVMFRNNLIVIVCFVVWVAPHRSVADDFRSATLAELRDIDARMDAAERIALLGERVDWQEHTLDELQEIRQRVLLADSLERFGQAVDWREYPLGVLQDRHARAWTADFLGRVYDQVVDWREHSTAELESIRARIEYARMLQEIYGHHVDWTSYSIAEMRDLRRKMIIAVNRRRHQGVEIDWRNVTLPPDPLDDLDAEFATLVRSFASAARTTPRRVLALVERVREKLRTEGIDVETESLVSAALELDERTDLSIPDWLAGYAAYRRNGLSHAAAVDRIVDDYVRHTRTLMTQQEADYFTAVSAVREVAAEVGMLQWRIEYEKWTSNDPLVSDRGYYRVVAHVVNQGNVEVALPARGTMLTLVDQGSREFSAVADQEASRQRQEDARPAFVFRPALGEQFTYLFEVPRNTQVMAFKIRQIDETVDHFDGDPFEASQVQD